MTTPPPTLFGVRNTRCGHLAAAQNTRRPAALLARHLGPLWEVTVGVSDEQLWALAANVSCATCLVTPARPR
jgi:hypothetical protein